MLATEFSDYEAYFVVDYAEEMAANYGYSAEKSQALAVAELLEDLPQTIATPDNVLLCIETAVTGTVGYLWYKLLDEGKSVFILDFVVFEQYRGLGYGKAALAALETQLVESGVEQIKLRVAFHNHRAKGLYEALGFTITGYNMIKLVGN